LTGEADTVYSNPLPHVLILTAIVVGVATTAVGYALIIRIQESFGTIEDDDIIVLMEDGADASPSKGEVA
jgi:multicomponent Na+:H+ antiporter subunit C